MKELRHRFLLNSEYTLMEISAGEMKDILGGGEKKVSTGDNVSDPGSEGGMTVPYTSAQNSSLVTHSLSLSHTHTHTLAHVTQTLPKKHYFNIVDFSSVIFWLFHLFMCLFLLYCYTKVNLNKTKKAHFSFTYSQMVVEDGW